MTITTIVGPNSVTLVVVPEDTKVDLRRLCGFPALGPGVTGFWQRGEFLAVYETFELRLNSLTQSEFTRITSFFLPNLYQLETDLFNLRRVVLVDTAAVFKRNKSEAKERHNEYSWWRKELCAFLGIEPGPNFQAGSSNNVSIRLG